MNTTKEQLIELVKRKAAGGDAPASIRGRFSPQEIEKFLDMVFDDMIYQTWKDGYKYNDFSQVDNYIKTFTLPIAYDSDREQNYVTLTVQPVPLPNNFALRQVSPPKNQSGAFAFVDNTSSPIFSNLEVSVMGDVCSCYVEGNKIYFDDKFPIGLTYVMVKMIVPFSSLRDTDSVTIPGGNNTLIFDKVFELMQKPPKVNQDNMVTKQV